MQTSDRIRRTALTLLGTLLAAGWAYAQSAPTPAFFTLGREFEQLQVRTITSKVTGRTHQLYVALPTGYGGSSDHYPTLFVLDADQQFLKVAHILGQMGTEVPPVIVVGLGYGEQPPDFGRSRMRDYSPTAWAKEPGSGGGPLFHRFVIEESVPFIDATYRTNPTDRALWGHSLGGLFATYALLERTSTFQRFILSSPSLLWDDQVLLRREREQPHRPLPRATVFLSVGERENRSTMIAFAREFATHLRETHPEITLTTAEIADESHGSVLPIAMVKGLRAIYRK